MNSMPFRQLKSFFKILIEVQYDRFFLRISEKIVIFGQNGRILKNHLTNGSC